MKSITNLALICSLAAILMLLPNTAQGLDVLIWDNDNYSTIDDPEGAGIVGCEYAIQQALTANGINYTTLPYMPIDLTPYDVLFITLGHWCYG
jgi:hypothetical protein